MSENEQKPAADKEQVEEDKEEEELEVKAEADENTAPASVKIF